MEAGLPALHLGCRVQGGRLRALGLWLWGLGSLFRALGVLGGPLGVCGQLRVEGVGLTTFPRLES